jgi:hypothetical protein
MAGVTTIVGCASRQPAAKEAASPLAPAQPSIFYDETGDPSEKTPPLSESELREIIDWVTARTSRPIWLIRVKPSYPGRRRAGVVAYLVPDEMTPRIRVGGALTVFQREIPVSPPEPYIQVSMADQTFTNELTQPSVTDLPFSWPMVIDPNSKKRAPMSREEVIRIVDFLRQPSTYEDPKVNWMGLSGPAGHRPHELPILQIFEERGEIDVTSGFQHGGQWGWGLGLTVECTATGYKAIKCYWWIL